MDVIVFKEFLAWMEERKFDHTQPFLTRMYNEDVAPCLDFTNKQVLVVGYGLKLIKLSNINKVSLGFYQ